MLHSQFQMYTPYLPSLLTAQISQMQNTNQILYPSEKVNNMQKRCQRKYNQITNEQRKELIDLVLLGSMPIKEAAGKVGIKLSTSKAILKTYKQHGRIGKKQNRDRKVQAKKEKLPKQTDPIEMLKATLPKTQLIQFPQQNLNTSFGNWNEYQNFNWACGNQSQVPITNYLCMQLNNQMNRPFNFY